MKAALEKPKEEPAGEIPEDILVKVLAILFIADMKKKGLWTKTDEIIPKHGG